MSQPLFSTEGSVWRTVPYTIDDEEEEDLVDQSLPSSPLDRTFGENAFDAGSSSSGWASPGRHAPLVHDEAGTEPKIEDHGTKIERDETPLREIGEDEFDEPEEEAEPEDERQCRICFSGREEEAALGKLISPCLCTGSVRVSRKRTTQGDS
jgi:hypothetical protein